MIDVDHARGVRAARREPLEISGFFFYAAIDAHRLRGHPARA